MLQVRATTPIRPSEDPAKVEKAVRTVFAAGDLRRRDDRVEAASDSLDRFKDLVWKEKILDAARRVLLASLDETGRRAEFELSKQAALAGHLSFAVAQSPLGDIHVEVEGDDLEALFKRIAPPTLNGRPVTEEAYERHLEARRKHAAQQKKADLIPPGEDE